MIDNLKEKMGDMSDEMRERMLMLKKREKDGTITDSERSELSRMRGQDNSAGQ